MDNYKWYPDDYQKDFTPKQSGMVVYEPPKKKRQLLNKPWIIATCTALITAILFTTAFGVFLYTPAFTNLIATKTGSAVIFRDGDDLRQKYDISGMVNPVASTKDGVEPMSVVEIARKVGPAVVGIVNRGQLNSFLNQTVDIGSGSGIIISSDGYIVTNNHVIEGGNDVTVILNTKEEYKAKLIGRDTKTDLAVIKIEATDLPSAPLGNSSEVEVGELAVAIGNPLGQELAGSVTAGVISAVNRSITVDGKTLTLLQTDAAINPGNSGGALVNAYGEVIGINTVKVASSGVEGIGFAIPANEAKPIIEELMKNGYVTGRPLIGIGGREITPEISRYYNLPEGIYIINVAPFSGAEKAGLKNGDIITHCNKEKVHTIDELNKIRDKFKAGDTITLTIIRESKSLDINVILTEEKPQIVQ